MASYLILNPNQLIGLANGKETQGYTCTAPASSSPIQSEADALTWLSGHTYSLVQIIGYGPMKEYVLTTTSVQQAGYHTAGPQPEGGTFPPQGGLY